MVAATFPFDVVFTSLGFALLSIVVGNNILRWEDDDMDDNEDEQVKWNARFTNDEWYEAKEGIKNCNGFSLETSFIFFLIFPSLLLI